MPASGIPPGEGLCIGLWIKVPWPGRAQFEVSRLIPTKTTPHCPTPQGKDPPTQGQQTGDTMCTWTQGPDTTQTALQAITGHGLCQH